MKQLLSMIILLVCNEAIFAQNDIYSPEEIWRQDASWTTFYATINDLKYDHTIPTIHKYSINGSIEHQGHDFMKVLKDDDAYCALRVADGKLIALTSPKFPEDLESAKEVICYDYNQWKLHTGISSQYLSIDSEGNSHIKEFSWGIILQSKKWIPSPSSPTKGFILYSTSNAIDDWNAYGTTLAASGLGFISQIELINPIMYDEPWAPEPWTLNLLEFKGPDGIIFRHPHYDEIKNMASGIHLLDAEGNHSQVYSITGTKLLQDASPSQIKELPTGLYIIHQGNKSKKIYVR